ncbi:MAG: glycosyltransferase family 2 protein [Anaerolineales bacterium]
MADSAEGGLPLVSILTPSLNQAEFIEDCLRSVVVQDYPRLEHRVVDGGSTDGTVEILRRYGSRLAGWTSRPDAGQAEAINAGVGDSRGEIVAWLNSDDFYYRTDTVSSAVRSLLAHPEAAFVYADGVMVDEGGCLLDWHRYPALNAERLMSFEVLLQPTVFMRRAAWEESGGLRNAYRLILDHDLWVRIARRHPIHHVSDFWAVERTHARAKTIADAARFVEEGLRLLAEWESDPEFRARSTDEQRRIRAGAHVFAAKRLIDAGDFAGSLRHLARAARVRPRSVLRVWYKLAHAAGGAAGLGGLFLTYRAARRRWQHASRHLTVSEDGIRWNRPNE